jgi:hypothetical protein
MTTNEHIDMDANAKYVEEYVETARAHGCATESGDADSANIAYDRLVRLLEEHFAGEQRSRLCTLLDHHNPSVRVFAAVDTSSIDRKKSERVLEEVMSTPGLVGFSAKMTLRELRAGRLKP